jgi:hypothetical protein
VNRLQISELPPDAINLNVHNRQLTGPLKGFGQLWQKTYRLWLHDVDVEPVEVIKIWKANFSGFWPEGNRFYGRLGGIAVGDVAVLNLAGPARSAISTGVMVIYADDESFSFMTPEGHIFAGMNTFSAYRDEEGGTTVVQIQVLVRASDPVYEIGCWLGVVHKQEDAFWHGTLENLARHMGTPVAHVEQQTLCVDPRLQWSEARNLWYNAAIRTTLNAPVRWMRSLLGKVGNF